MTQKGSKIQSSQEFIDFCNCSSLVSDEHQLPVVKLRELCSYLNSIQVLVQMAEEQIEDGEYSYNSPEHRCMMLLQSYKTNYEWFKSEINVILDNVLSVK